MLPALVLLITTSVAGEPRRPLPTIEWDASTLRLIEPGGDYARMARLGDGAIACAYDRGGKLLVRRSTDEGKTWAEPVLVAEDGDCWLTNSELLPLKNGELLYFWNERPRAALEYQHKDRKSTRLNSSHSQISYAV